MKGINIAFWTGVAGVVASLVMIIVTGLNEKTEKAETLIKNTKSIPVPAVPTN